jgi:hypothetical protein
VPTGVLELLPRADGPRYHSVTLAIEGGGVVLRSHEMGAKPEDAWGLDDEEVTLTVTADQAGRLALALVAELLRGDRNAVRRLADICEAHDVSCRVACWT